MWDLEQADKTYHISRWGNGYFGINDKGHITVRPYQTPFGPEIDIYDIIEEIKEKNIAFPVVLRFQDILRAQVQQLNETFTEVIEQANYQGTYRGVFPIKVNQLREVVEEILDAGEEFHYGLEAGSKAELLTVLAYNTHPDALTIVNGYKDLDYLKLALLGRTLDRKIIVVIEKFTELLNLITLAKNMDVKPLIGLRVKLAAKGIGKWADSGGDKAKFGLTIPEILRAIDIIKKHGLINHLKLIHFHIGSQITDIRIFKDALTEAARIYAKLVKMEIPIEYLDVGGGLGINYDGTNSVQDSSTNYNMREYIEDVVYIVKQICDLENVSHPHLVTESGRAITAYHSCIITDIFGKIKPGGEPLPKPVTHDHIFVHNIFDLYQDLHVEHLQEAHNDAIQYKQDALNAFKLGVLSLEERGKIEIIYWKILEKIIKMATDEDQEERSINLGAIKAELSQQYLGNFSVFQSTVDSWAIGQILPIVPITHLDQEPTLACSLVDITCDSDGQIKQYIGSQNNPSPTMPIHEISPNEEYYLGIFLTGAYQDIMGDTHNLFGRVNEVHIYCDDEDPEDYYIEEFIPGNTSAQILQTLQYSPPFMAATVKKAIEQKMKEGKIRPKEAVALADFYEERLNDYTYLK